MLSKLLGKEKGRIISEGIIVKFRINRYLRKEAKCNELPKSSDVLRNHLKQRNYPHWTAWYVPCCDVENDLWGESHFNFEVEKDINYHVLRTGAFPFIKFHCSKRRWENLQTENILYCFLKIINLGIPTLLYGIAGLLWAKHTEIVHTSNGRPITIYFWYPETKNSKY